jgi:predicted enzyme related to lactoylglutathione lyase
MGEYNDFNMCEPATGTPVAGVCHARGGNAGLPPLWLIYINVEDLDRSIERCVALGGAVIVGSKCMGEQGRVCVVRDPAGAAVALFEPPKSS